MDRPAQRPSSQPLQSGAAEGVLATKVTENINLAVLGDLSKLYEACRRGWFASMDDGRRNMYLAALDNVIRMAGTTLDSTMSNQITEVNSDAAQLVVKANAIRAMLEKTAMKSMFALMEKAMLAAGTPTSIVQHQTKNLDYDAARARMLQRTTRVVVEASSSSS